MSDPICGNCHHPAMSHSTATGRCLRDVAGDGGRRESCWCPAYSATAAKRVRERGDTWGRLSWAQRRAILALAMPAGEHWASEVGLATRRALERRHIIDRQGFLTQLGWLVAHGVRMLYAGDRRLKGDDKRRMDAQRSTAVLG